ncbi:MAG: hypothetical protein WDW36_006960 [Sanguina aurantia]
MLRMKSSPTSRSDTAARQVPKMRLICVTRASATNNGALNQLEQLRKMSCVVADSGEIEQVKRFSPIDCTTNPSLVYKAIELPQYRRFLSEAIAQKSKLHDGTSKRQFDGVADILCVNLGCEMLKVVPGRVSTEVDAHLSHDTRGTVNKALRLVDLYAAQGVDATKRVYIKIASTWEGIEACRVLEAQGIKCNMTLLFSFAQTAACADAGASLISPFVGRIMDWYKAKEGREFAPHEDPGVMAVKKAYSYLKVHKYPTVVMAASFRNLGEIRQLAGCDNITIAPNFLADLEACYDPLPRMLSPDSVISSLPRLVLGHKEFQELHASDKMAVDKLREGIEGFAKDQDRLEQSLAALAV